MNYEPYNDRQGRDNPHSVNASRAALGLPPLHRDSGNVYPELIEDEAVYAFDDVMHALRYGLAVAALSCAAFLGSLALALVLSHFRL